MFLRGQGFDDDNDSVSRIIRARGLINYNTVVGGGARNRRRFKEIRDNNEYGEYVVTTTEAAASQ